MADPDPKKDDQLEQDLKGALRGKEQAEPVARTGRSDKTKAALARKTGTGNGAPKKGKKK